MVDPRNACVSAKNLAKNFTGVKRWMVAVFHVPGWAFVSAIFCFRVFVILGMCGFCGAVILGFWDYLLRGG